MDKIQNVQVFESSAKLKFELELELSTALLRDKFSLFASL